MAVRQRKPKNKVLTTCGADKPAPVAIGRASSRRSAADDLRDVRNCHPETGNCWTGCRGALGLSHSRPLGFICAFFP